MCLFLQYVPLVLTDRVYIQDVALAALYVSTKMHDTLKKPRELLAVSYAVRFPEFAAKSKHPAGEVDLDTMDAQVRFSTSLYTRLTHSINVDG